MAGEEILRLDMKVRSMATVDITQQQEIRAAIIQRSALNDEDVAWITHYQETRELSFAEAASRLGYVSPSDGEKRSDLVPLPWAKPAIAVPSQDLVIAHDRYHAHSEQIRSLRTELLLRQEPSAEGNMLAVLSPCSGEGRSVLAAELAIAFAQLGRPTLLVDADMRRSHQHVLFTVENEYGLSDALAEARRPQLHEVSGFPELSLLTAGQMPVNAQELLSGSRFAPLVDEWREYYDFVVFDTPPASRFADGLVVATIVGNVLSLSRARHTPYKDTSDLLQRLVSTGSSIQGAVVNHF